MHLPRSLQTLLYRKTPTCKAHISLFGAFDPALHSTTPILGHASTRAKPKAQPISDPYYGGASGFEQAYWQCAKYASGFLDFLENGEQWDSVPAAVGHEARQEVREAMGA